MSDLVVPRIGVAVTEVTIEEWLVEDGTTVTEGDPILTVATDKTEVEIEAPASGVLRQSGLLEETYAVGAVIGSIV
ncbi:dihydrolipoamide acyltransferase [Rhodococcus sp. WS4]|nr:dihydrolipoamide acyltransferase [Rhodococcus sp. WS4]